MNEDRQRDPSRSVRRFAGVLLVLMFLLLLLAQTMIPVDARWSWLAAFSEAALVGGLADWFAVTALFRRPLGLPIPHTAILPTNRHRLADSIAEFLERNFLTQEVLAREFAQVDFATLMGHWLSSRAHRRWLVRQCLRQGGEFIQWGPLLAEWILVVMERQGHQRVFDQLLAWAVQTVEEQQAVIYLKVSEKSPRWMPRRFNDEFFRRLVEGVLELLDEMREPDSDARTRFTELLGQLAQRFAQGQADALYAELLPHSGRRIPSHLEAQLASVGERLLTDPELRVDINQRLRSQATLALMRQRHQVVGLVRRVVLSWDVQSLVQRVEQPVGRDLQFIRINGTLVGGLVGLMLCGLRIAPM